MNLKRLSLSMVLVLTALGLGAWRHGGGEGHGPGMERLVQRLTEGLELNADQKGKLQTVLDAIKEARKESREARKANHEAIANLVAAKELDTKKLGEILDSQRSAMEKARPQILAKLADFHKSLTDDQRQKLAEKLRKMGRRHGAE